MTPKIIVFEGLDGCGKSTQVEEFLKRLKANGISYRYLKFPNYNSSSSAPIKSYLNGEMGKNAEEINAFQSSILFSTDRVTSYLSDWRKDYEDDKKIIVIDRYVFSNAIYQGAKMKKNGDFLQFLSWLKELEFNKLKLPKPDLTFFLDIDPDVSQKLMSKRYNGNEAKKDIHENNVEYLKKCRVVAKQIATGENWEVISVLNNENKIRTIDNIANQVYQKFSCKM